MHILISNDDGYQAPGLSVLADTLRSQHHRVTIVAPRQNMSGCGMALSLRRSIAVENLSKTKHEQFFVVDGTPADCVYIGLNNLVNEPVDLVISGINNGPNLADDILYSGTFAAAMEARRMAMPSIALSIPQRDVQHYETAAYVALQMSNVLPQLLYRSLLAVLNVNVPDVPVTDLRGYKATVLGEREAPLAPFLDTENQREDSNLDHYTLGLVGDFRRIKRKQMQDFEAVEQGYASITPLSAKFDDSAYVDDVQTWLNEL